jgi:hypothetical protein
MIARDTNGYPPPPAGPHEGRARESGSSSDTRAQSSAVSSASSAEPHGEARPGEACHRSERANGARADRRPASESLESAFSHAVELADHVHTLIQVRADRARIAVRRSVMIGVAIVLAAAALAPIIVGGSVLFTIGLAQSLTHFFGDRAWLGNLLGGALILGSIALCAWAAYARIARRELANKSAKYERMRREREVRFGPNPAAQPRSSGAAQPQSAPTAAGGE